MKILLINPPIREWSKPNVLPLGLGYIASALRNAGNQVEVMDINAYRWQPQEVEEKIKKAEFDLVGIGAIVTTYKYVKWLITVLKKHHPDKEIVVGGTMGSSIPRIMLEKTKADIVCVGEGEVTMRELTETLETNKNLTAVDGIWFKDANGNICSNKVRKPIQNLDEIPFPAWDLFPMEIYLKNPIGALNRNKWVDGSADNSVASMNMNATRGCPYQCIYCYHDFMGTKHRHRSPQNVVSEMRILYNDYKVRYFHFPDDAFCLKKDFVYSFCEIVKQEFNNDITWCCSGRVNLMTEDMISTMADAGCILLCYGIESGSQKILDIIKKRVTVEQAKEAVRLTVKYMGWADCSFMIGSPGETRETLQETIDFCKELNLVPEVIFFTTPYPGTELYSRALAEGKIKEEEEYILNLGEQGEKVRVNFTEFPDEELFGMQEKMIKELNAWNKIKHPESR